MTLLRNTATLLADRDALREKAIAFGVHDAADLVREWGHAEIADRLRDEALARYITDAVLAALRSDQPPSKGSEAGK